MPFTLLDLKRTVRGDLWPQGEARSQRPSHDRSIVEALVDLQTNVPCLQRDNTKIHDHCATYFKCGLTVFETPVSFIGHINSLSVVVRLNEDNTEDAASPISWCTEIPYVQVDMCYIRAWMQRQNKKGGCTNNLANFFSIPSYLCGGKGVVPVPTDEDLPSGLPSLPLGFHYPQANTDATRRARSGVWAIERGMIYVAPWIQSTEAVVVRWDGVKTEWQDGDLVQENPKLITAVEYYLQKEHSKRFGRTADELNIAAIAEVDFRNKRAEMMKDCADQSRVRGCETSHARGSIAAVTIFYNDEQKFTASCPPNKLGGQFTATILQDTYGSTISKADANRKAQDEARRQAEDSLECTDKPVTYWNTEQAYTANCEGGEGEPVTVTIQANTISSIVSQADADALALAAAQEQAEDQISCIYWNAEQTYEATCAEGQTGDPVEKTVAAHTYSSTISQVDADEKALNEAKRQAMSELSCSGPPLVANTQQIGTKTGVCPAHLAITCTVKVTVPAGLFYGVTQGEANSIAQNYAQMQAELIFSNKCAADDWPSYSPCLFEYTMPGPP